MGLEFFMEIQGIYFRHTHSETKRKYPRKQISYSGADPGSSVFLILGVTGTFGTKKENKTSNGEKRGGGWWWDDCGPPAGKVPCMSCVLTFEAV